MEDGCCFDQPQFLWCILLGCWDLDFLPTNEFFIRPLKVKLLAEQSFSHVSPVVDFGVEDWNHKGRKWGVLSLCSFSNTQSSTLVPSNVNNPVT